MFLAVIATYAIATAFAFCGIVNTVGYIAQSQQGMGSYVFIEGLALAMWPLAVAAGLVMLVQIATQIERWRLLWTMAQATAPAPAAKAAAPKATTPATPAAPASRSDALEAVTPPVMEAAPAATPEAIPLPPNPATLRDSQPAAPRQEGLNFFKLD